MPKKRKDSLSSKPSTGEFRPGPAGTGEPLLFEFSSERGNRDIGLDAEKTIATTHRIAASSILQAVKSMTEHEPEFRPWSVRTIGLIVLL
jgi:hypothetical protein